ncbi:hypothetical protein EVAR_97866_1 [Eumeta japonica]|uniref:Uncharacterized protein n=1 Tax=Eumeta variegata TaxID=151549 RepID=A0A4C1WW45_EUMVA|nr:hypothetical protein EVAR_97866_1 [Eumeta japonica]
MEPKLKLSMGVKLESRACRNQNDEQHWNKNRERVLNKKREQGSARSFSWGPYTVANFNEIQVVSEIIVVQARCGPCQRKACGAGLSRAIFEFYPPFCLGGSKVPCERCIMCVVVVKKEHIASRVKERCVKNQNLDQAQNRNRNGGQDWSRKLEQDRDQL